MVDEIRLKVSENYNALGSGQYELDLGPKIQLCPKLSVIRSERKEGGCHPSWTDYFKSMLQQFYTRN